jgi:uncharacterized protein (TIGR00304 family)
MRTLRALGLASLLAGGLLLAYAATTGDVRVGLFLIVPFVYGTGLAPFLGILLVMAGLFMVAASSFAGVLPPRGNGEWVEGERRVESRSGGVVLLGPIPIVWGSDRRILPWMVGAGVALLVLALLLTWR